MQGAAVIKLPKHISNADFNLYTQSELYRETLALLEQDYSQGNEFFVFFAQAVLRELQAELHRCKSEDSYEEEAVQEL